MAQPDGYLTEERKAQEPDQGFSTFFSETGTKTCPARALLAMPPCPVRLP